MDAMAEGAGLRIQPCVQPVDVQRQPEKNLGRPIRRDAAFNHFFQREIVTLVP